MSGGVENSIVDVETGKTTALGLPPNHGVCDWSHDGRWLLTHALPEGSPPRGHLYLAKLDGTIVRRLSGTEHKKSVGCGRFSFDGKHASYPADGHLFLVDIAGGMPRRLTRDDSVEVAGHCWSPDGKHVAYTCRERWDPEAKSEVPAESQLCVLALEGGDPRTLMTVTDRPGFLPLYFPDWR